MKVGKKIYVVTHDQVTPAKIEWFSKGVWKYGRNKHFVFEDIDKTIFTQKHLAKNMAVNNLNNELLELNNQVVTVKNKIKTIRSL
ncbi:MAG: hypothetical protein R3Y05_06575 [bacterium]